MESYRVQKIQARVVISVPPHPPEERVLFLSPYAQTHDGPETVSDLLTDMKRFLPALSVEKGVYLVRTEAIRWLKIGDPEQAEWRFGESFMGVPHARIRCEFSDGEALEGTLNAVAPPGAQRVLDVLNLQRGFLHLMTSAGLHLVNRGQVCRVFILEDTHGGT
ncbi:MAG TPA: hypothetical protein PLS53_02680 [Thermoanaerobaculaceae bacterium]|mgnify:CR=1 FL=1|nr:hypothetical protein [Thermoanaerobaculaceae bacterium]HPS77038.1 hypothetical protein [Thermoanaerobaculaceae bacterium]